MPDLLTAQQVAERLQVSESWVKKRAQARELAFYRVAGQLRFSWSDVVRFLERQRVAPTPRGASR